MGPYAVEVLIRAYFMVSHPVAIYTINNARVSYILVVAWYRSKSGDFCVGAWCIDDDGVPAYRNIHLTVK